MARTPDENAQTFINILRQRRQQINKGSQLYEAILNFLGLPLQIKADLREQVLTEICVATGLTLDAIKADVQSRMQVQQAQIAERQAELAAVPKTSSVRLKMKEAQVREDELAALLPQDGFFARYATYTLESEAPLSYHLFCAIAGMAATVNRRVFLDMGNHKLYPPFGVFILGNSGIKKTSAADIIVSLLRESALTPIYAEKLTPEALIDGMRNGNATGLVYAPEMTVLISKQKYMESIIPLLTRFMDSPDHWNSGTIMRGKAELRDVAITCIMCSTIDWFVKNTPESLFGGGFIARNVMVMQEYSPRLKPLPPAEDASLRSRLLIDLATAYELQGQAQLSRQAYEAHCSWYTWNKMEHVATSELFETYFSRKPSHLLRIALILHIGTHGDLIVCRECWERALRILEWVESHFDLLNGKMFKTQYGEDQESVLRLIERAGGEMQWSVLLRAVSSRLPAQQLRIIVMNLKEMGVLEEQQTALGHLVRLRSA